MLMMPGAQSVIYMLSVLKLRLQVRQEPGSEILYFAVCCKLETLNNGQDPRD